MGFVDLLCYQLQLPLITIAVMHVLINRRHQHFAAVVITKLIGLWPLLSFWPFEGASQCVRAILLAAFLQFCDQLSVRRLWVYRSVLWRRVRHYYFITVITFIRRHDKLDVTIAVFLTLLFISLQTFYSHNFYLRTVLHQQYRNNETTKLSREWSLPIIVS